MSKAKLRKNPLNLYSLYGNIRKTKDINTTILGNPDVYYKINNYYDITQHYKRLNFTSKYLFFQ